MKIRISFIEEEVDAIATLLKEKAPKTCEAIWKQLDEPLELLGKHAMWTGPEISLQIPPEKALPELSEIPPENQTIFPSKGSLVWAYMPSHAFAGIPHPIYDLGLFYGPQGRVLLPVGWVPCNWFGQFEGDWQKFEEVCRSTLIEGAKTLRFERSID